MTKEHWVTFAECIASKSIEQKLEMHVQDLLDKKNLSNVDEDSSLQEAIDKIWIRIIAIILNSCIDALPHYWKLNADMKCQTIKRKKRKKEKCNHLHTAKLAYLWHLCNHPGKLLAKDNEHFRLNWTCKIKNTIWIIAMMK